MEDRGGEPGVDARDARKELYKIRDAPGPAGGDYRHPHSLDHGLQQVKITDGSGVTYTLIATQKNGPKLTVRESCTTMTTVEGTEQTATGAWHE